MNLRPYQQEFVAGIRQAFGQGHRCVLVVLGTGGGKTVIFSYVTQSVEANGKRTLILTHRREIFDQIVRTLGEFGVRPGLIAAGEQMNQFPATQVGSIDTVARRLDKIRPPSLIILDEAHHCVSPTWKKVIAHWQKAKVLGVTATPQRLDGRGLGSIFTHMVRGPEVKWLIEQGYLSKPVYFVPPQQVDLRSVHTVAGDYNQGELEEAMNTPKITGDAVQHYTKHAGGELAVVFCVSVRHAEDVAAAFRAAGHPAASIDGTMTKEQRRDVLRRLARRDIRVLTSCALIGEGVDIPAVSVASLLRPTQSLSLHLQQLGRPLRPAPGKTRTLILDHVGNVLKHGFAEDVREWSLEDLPKAAKKTGESSVTVRQCPQCFCCHAPAPSCPECGHVYVAERVLEVVDGELEQVSVVAECEACGRGYNKLLASSCPFCRIAKRREEGAAQTYEQLAAIAAKRGYKPGWARFRWAARMKRRQVV